MSDEKYLISLLQRLIKQEPRSAVYWYFLAEAQSKAGRMDQALVAVDTALSLPSPFPSKEKLIRLKELLMPTISSRAWRLYPASLKTVKGVKWGYINDKGQFVLPPNYNYASEFAENGLAVVAVHNLNGLIDETGRFVVAPKYSTITEFAEGRAAVADDKGFYVIDENGKQLTTKPYSFIGQYHEGRAMASQLVQGSDRYGYLDLQGREVIPLQFESATDFMNGNAVVGVKEGEYALINKRGDKLQTYKYPFVGNQGEGLFVYQKEPNGKYGYIDEKGNVVLDTQYTGAQAFIEGRAVVNSSTDYTNKFGLIDKKGRMVIPTQYNDIDRLGEQRVAVGIANDVNKPYLGSRYALADLDGHFLSDFKFNTILSFKNGLSSASDEQKTFFIDRSAQTVQRLPILSGNGTLAIEGDLIRANVDQRTYYLSPEGKIVWQQNTQIPLSTRLSVREEKYKPNKDYLVYYPQIEGIGNREKQHQVNQKLRYLSLVKPVDPHAQLESSYTGDFDITFFQKNLIVLELDGYDYPFGAAHGMPTKVYPHVDLVSGQFYVLKDLFKPGSHYVQILSGIIGNQIKNNDEYSYVFPDSYKGIKEDQPFYVMKDTLNIYFPPYEIAPYAAGFPTFRIPFQEIMKIINENGEFWKSFH
ncbi:MAG TPA: WG repeat-containing protein [Bacillota bacterium]|nr:WG repeat-containing protein [Bacillota bacterium]